MGKHHSHNSSTQDSEKPKGASVKPYQSGAKAGSGGAKADPDGGAPASTSRQSGYTRSSGR